MTELNQLELQFLLLNNFSLMISQEEMQFYASKLVRQGQVPPGVSLLPFLPESSPSVPHDPRLSPVGPLTYFSGLDAYVSHLHVRTHSTRHDSISQSRAYTSPHSYPAPEYRRSASAHSTSSASDAATEGDTETEFDGETDDEPTIRAPQSTVSSDADSIYTEDSQSEMGEDAHPYTNGVREDYHHRQVMSP